MIRAIFHIARRDFIATIFSRGFIIWLLMPIIGVAIVTTGTLLAGPASSTDDAVAVLDGGGAAPWLRKAALRLERFDLDPPPLTILPAAPDPAAQARRLLSPIGSRHAARFGLVLHVADPELRMVRVYVLGPARRADIRMPSLLVSDARHLRHGTGPIAIETLLPVESVKPIDDDAQAYGAEHGALAIGIAMTLFTLIGLLAGSLLSNMIEEKANKVIEVLVACVSVPAIFAGKLLGMLAISLVGVTIWGVLFGTAALAVAAQLPLSLVPMPAIGWPALLMLDSVYLVTAYLLFGAIYLGIGSLCSSIREVQSLSLPITIVQMVVLMGVLGAINHPKSAWAAVMAWFPLSSPYMMAARTALEPGIGIHMLAIAWQLACATLVIWASARLFHHGVLRSGPAPSLFGRRGRG